MQVYVDESGDLGFSEKATKFFAIAYVVCNSGYSLEKNLKRHLKDFHERRKYSRNMGELKWARSNNDVRRKVLETIRDSNAYLGCIVLNKSRVYPDLRSPPVLYNYLIANFMLWDLLPNKFDPDKGMALCVDLSMTRAGRDAFNSYFGSKAHWIWTKDLSRPGFDISCISVQHENSERIVCLQAADYVAGAAFSKLMRGDNFFGIIEDRVNLIKVFF
jgi:hypothetical protein